jgi:4-hydroxymandelate oxidase
MSLKCRECKFCNGIACRGEIPGLGGKDSGRSFIRNVEKMEEIKINMDVLVDDAPISTETNILNMKMSAPIFVAPVAGINGNYGADISEYDYNCNVLEACEKAGIVGFTGDGIDMTELFIKPTQAVNDHNGKGIVTIKPWVKEGVDARIEAIKDMQFMAVAMDVDAAGLPLLRAGKTPVENKNVEKLRYIKEQLNKPFIVKGIMTVSAAKVALEAGADAIVVSNHGGRVLDDSLATIEVLEDIVNAVGDKMTILVDGGIRSGMDVFKCLALGADGVLVGRPFALSCIKGGSEGLKNLISTYQDQLASTMRMTGCHSIKDIDRTKVTIK